MARKLHISAQNTHKTPTNRGTYRPVNNSKLYADDLKSDHCRPKVYGMSSSHLITSSSALADGGLGQRRRK